MNPYQAPLGEMNFLLEKLFDTATLWRSIPELEHRIDMDTANIILTEADKFARELLQPINASGDLQGVKLEGTKVSTPDGYKEVYNRFVQNGWAGLCGAPQYGGMGIPKMLTVLTDEMAYSANNAFTLYLSLAAGAALCIERHGSDKLKQLYLPKLYSGQWAAAMNMTEAAAGSDLRQINTTAIANEDGSYHLTGTKLFITGGDHDLTENIIHLVLAKSPQSNGLSLFLVPKINVSDDGELTSPNNVTATSIEQKMGIKASATCAMNYNQAQGFLIGKPNRGLIYMFTMMNDERLSVAIQGLGNAQMAYQMAVDYARNRLQGVAAGSAQGGGDIDAIIMHGDVRRMLLTIRSLTEAGRALAVYTAQQLDLAQYATGEAKVLAQRFAELLTPLAKAFMTDRGLDCTILAQQVFGGHGYTHEMGVEQLVRDCRITQIYEGTNGIQAIDFLGRKITGDNLVTLKAFIEQCKKQLAECSNIEQHDKKQVEQLFEQLLTTANRINQAKLESPALINCCAVDYLNAFGYTLYGFYWLIMADRAAQDSHQEQNFTSQKVKLAKFYILKLLPKAHFHLQQVDAGEGCIMAVTEQDF